MCKLYLAIGCLWFLLCGQMGVACSCFNPTLQELIARSDAIILGKVERMQKDKGIKLGQSGKGALSELSVIKGTANVSQLAIDVSYGGFCPCGLPTYHKGLETLTGTYVIAFFARRENELVWDDLIECDTRGGCDVHVQRINEMIAIQKSSDWQKSDAEMKWLLECMTNDVTMPYTYNQLFEWKDRDPVLKDFTRSLDDDLKKRLEARLYASAKIGCREAHLLLLVANWEDEKVLPLALQFLRNEKEKAAYFCDGDLLFDSLVERLLPNLMRMIAMKADMAEAATFAGLFRERDGKEVISEFLSFVEQENKKRQQQKVRYAVALAVGLVGVAFVVYIFRKRHLAIIRK